MSQPAEHRPNNAIDVIMGDHRRVDHLFDRIEAKRGDDPEIKRELAREIVTELSIHAAIEEQVFYPAVREHLPEGDTVVEHSLDEHRAVKELLAAIEDTDPADTKFDERVTMLIREVRHHVDEEETVILPGLRQQLDHEFLLDLGGRLEKAKATAPTHPHPLAPNSGPAATVAGRAMGLIDRVKDEIARED